jgi:hypothetical protein
MAKSRVEFALGAEIMEFYDHHWPSGYFHDDSQIEFHEQNPPPDALEDIWILNPAEKYDLSQCGVLIHEKSQEVFDFSMFFKIWKKSLNSVTLQVVVPKEKEREIRAYLTQNSCKVLK